MVWKCLAAKMAKKWPKTVSEKADIGICGHLLAQYIVIINIASYDMTMWMWHHITTQCLSNVCCVVCTNQQSLMIQDLPSRSHFWQLEESSKWLLLAFCPQILEGGGDLLMVLCHSINVDWVVGTLRGGGALKLLNFLHPQAVGMLKHLLILELTTFTTSFCWFI